MMKNNISIPLIGLLMISCVWLEDKLEGEDPELIFYIVPEFIPIWMLIIILIRDISVTVIRVVSKKKNVKFKTSNFAKVKTVIQSVSIHISILLVIANYYYPVNMKLIYYVMFFSVLITFLTGLDYLNCYLKQRNDE